MAGPTEPIPLAKPHFGGRELERLREVLASGWITQGPMVKAFEEAFARHMNASYACATSNCTTALHLALTAVGVLPGDFVITASHSFIASANAIRHCNAEPLFVDIDAATYNLDPAKVDAFIQNNCEQRDNGPYLKNASSLATAPSPLAHIDPGKIGRVGAILAIHQMGMPCDLGRLAVIADRYGIPLVEDAACAAGSLYSLDGGLTWKNVGNPVGKAACFSFHPRKIITAGDGGMVTTHDEEIDQRCRLLRQHAMSISDTQRHSAQTLVIESYLETGFNYRMTDLQAAVALSQLEQLDIFITQRRKVADLYNELLAPIEWLSAPREPVYGRSNWQSYPVRILEPNRHDRNGLINSLLAKKISAKPGIMNAHREPPYQNHAVHLPLSEKAQDEVILLPLFFGQTEEQVEQVVAQLKAYNQ